ncbi:uncharacterized protein LOC142235280 [Haematobia irritans]|uniref:uncharacterized protein LOC142235280 n=1 Tax=Haematobia irritans TaxID=7368 RepID=UPI003F4FA998
MGQSCNALQWLQKICASSKRKVRETQPKFLSAMDLYALPDTYQDIQLLQTRISTNENYHYVNVNEDKRVREAVIRRITTSSDEVSFVFCYYLYKYKNKWFFFQENEIEVLQKKIRETEDQLEALKQSQALPEITVEQSVQCSDDEEQLLGSNFDEKMICIGNNIYCRAIIHNMALGTSHKASHVARKLLEGVFKRNVLKKATLTEQPPRAQGLETQLEPVFALNYRAK